MIEQQEMARFARHAATFGAKINDADALRQAAVILDGFEDAFYEAVGRLNRVDGVSWRDLGRGAGVSGPVLFRRYTRWQRRRARAASPLPVGQH